MKKLTKVSIAIVSAFSVISLAQAATPGGYLGAGLGYSYLKTPNPSTGTSRNNSGVAGRVFGGFNVNQYFGLEAGYTRYTNSKYKNSASGNTLEYTLSSLDVVGKGYLPISDTGFNVYGLAGLAYAMSTTKLALAGLPTQKSNNKHVTPVYGVGASYDFSDHVSTNLEYKHLQGRGNVKTMNGIPSADSLMLNISYNFG